MRGCAFLFASSYYACLMVEDLAMRVRGMVFVDLYSLYMPLFEDTHLECP